MVFVRNTGYSVASRRSPVSKLVLISATRKLRRDARPKSVPVPAVASSCAVPREIGAERIKRTGNRLRAVSFHHVPDDSVAIGQGINVHDIARLTEQRKRQTEANHPTPEN